MAEQLKDLLVLVSDRNMEAAISGILSRNSSLGVRPLDHDIRRHPRNDAGCFREGVEYLRPFASTYQYAIFMFDLEGSGAEDKAVTDLEAALEQQLKTAGWADRAAVIVFNPELEVLVWSDSPHVDTHLGWTDRRPSLRRWLKNQQLLQTGQMKPARPKEAMEAALRFVKLPRSSAIYLALAKSVSLNRCDDRSFQKLKSVLRTWFGARRWPS
jgi:hypothetical protein